MGRLLDALESAACNFQEILEKQRRSLGEAHRLRNEIVHETKYGIALLKKGRISELKGIRGKIFSLSDKLTTLNLPEDVLWQFKAEAAQEITEFQLVAFVLYGYVFENKEFAMGSFELFISAETSAFDTPQACLAGLIDSVSEVGKTLNWFFMERKLDVDKHIEIRKRFLEIANDAHDFLSRFESIPEQIVNNSRRQGYNQTYRSQLSRLEQIIEREQERVVNLMEKSLV